MSEENNSQKSTNSTAEGNSESLDIQSLQEQLEKAKSDFLYLRAEFENYKRNAIKERSELVKYAGERIVRDLLDVVDNFERALEVEINADNFNTYKQGVELTATEFKNLLQKHSITELPSQGTAFDPNIHDALGSEPSNEIPEGHVLRVFKKPYKYHDKVIRTGQVVVSKKPE